MKRLINVILLLLFIFKCNILSSQLLDKIIWKQKKLEWSDFKKSNASINVINDSTTEGAASSLGLYKIAFVRNDSIFLRVYSYFIPSKSWTIDTSKEGLAHEQLHFDIMELFTRLYKERLSRGCYNDISVLNDSINRIYNEMTLEYINMQNKYDEETNHNLRSDIQMEWQFKIHEFLNQKIKYADRDVYIFKVKN